MAISLPQSTPDPLALRISPHGYATTGEVDRLIGELRKIGPNSR